MFKSLIFRSVFLLASVTITNSAIEGKNIKIETPKTSMVLDATKEKPLKFLYYGTKITDNDANNLKTAGTPNVDAYPAYGFNLRREAAVAAKHADGNMTLELVVDSVWTTNNEQSQTHTIRLKDTFYPLTVDVNYLAYHNEDMIETWTEISHDEDGTVELSEFASGCIPLRYGNVWLTQLHGAWGNEGRIDSSPLTHGLRVIKNNDGIRNSHFAHSEVMLSLDGKPQENDGRVIGAALCYGGNFKLVVDTDEKDYHKFYAGINPENSHYHLEKGETFITPHLALTYSNEGIGGVSRNFHRWARNHRLAHGDKPRKILLNSWEGVHFDIKEKEMEQMMADIADMGGELFVMDDGWFGVKYPRNDGTQGLGDWIVNKQKLPHGLKGLIKAAKNKGISFGIWIEPEMINANSELYDQHPEYVVKANNRKEVYGRGGSQMVLDLSNPEVQQRVFQIVDTLMTQYPEIDYIKWDCNNMGMSHGSQYLPADKQSHLYIEYFKGLESVLNLIREKYPDVTIQACASGGGRVNYGILPWFDEVWTSDNTDALQRVYLQWGNSYFFPAIALGSHISATPNLQTYRSMPLKYRTDVAMSGRLGLEMQPNEMTAEEKKQTRKAIEEYKSIRHIIQQGDLYRLMSPYDGLGVASILYTTPEKDDAVYFWWKTEAFRNQQMPRVKMAGLDPDKNYRVMELNRIDKKPLKFEGKVFSGRYLMDNGLEMPVGYDVDTDKRTEWGSRVLRLTAQ
ncbi:MAG: alpha-galactosidase [Muribaculaceae bacterium]|nr:alpha-galactosidase [Muribaculaceae bacterium]